MSTDAGTAVDGIVCPDGVGSKAIERRATLITWQDLVTYVRAHYKIAQEQSDMISLLFQVEGARSQLAFLSRHLLMGGTEEWVQIWSPIGDAGSIDLQAVLEETGGLVCGGLAIVNGHLVIRDAVPLANMDIAEFERPLLLVTTTADALEKKYVGGDAM
jgi:hypothetical protein